MATDRDPLLSGFRTRRSSHQARRRRTLALERLENRIVLTQLQYGLFDTGVDNSGNTLAGGATDTHYTLPVTQQGTANMNAVAASSLAGGWVANGSTHAWIAPTADQQNATSPGGTYRYETTFQVPQNSSFTSPIAAIISGQLAADDNVTDILIDGVSTGFTATNALGTFTPLNLKGTVVTGTNTLDVIVLNGATGPTGLQLENLILDLPPTVTADQPTLNVAYGGTATNTGSFATPNPADTVSLSSSLGTITQSGTNSGTYTFSDSNVTTSTPITITATNSSGGITTTTFTINEAPPSLTSGNKPITVRSGGAAAVVDPNITLNDPSGPNLTTASISIGTNFTAAEDQLLFSDQNGITGAYNSSTGILTLSGSATPAQYQTALRSVAYQDTNSNPSTANQSTRTISFSISPGTYNPDNGHFYQFFRNPGITWTAAKAAADASNVYGLQGYLATLTSAAENTFAFSKTLSTGWIGASDAANPGVWAWADGPESGLQFWSGTRNGTPVPGQYNDWNMGEPNDAGGVEFYAQYLSSGLWNDLANTAVVQGYLVEYGGSAGDPTLQLTSQATANVISISDVPAVTSPLAALSLNAPNTTITGTADAGSLVRIYNDVNDNGAIDLGETVVGTEQLAAGQTSYSIALPLTQNSANHFLVTATVNQAAESSPMVVPTIIADSIPPVLPTVTTPAGTVTLNAQRTGIDGTAEAGSLVEVYADTNNDGIIDAGDTVVGTQQLGATSTAYSISTPLTPNAVNHFLVTATDAAGNQSAAATVPTITTDSIPPAIPTIDNPSAATSVNTAGYTLTGTAEAGSLVKVYGDTNANGAIDTGEVVVGFEQLAPGQTSYSITVPLVANVANHFLVTATDAAGNASSPLVAPTITQNLIPPTLPVVLTPATSISVNAGATTITGTAQADSLVRIYHDFNQNGIIDIGDAVVGTEQLAGGATAYSITVPLDQNTANSFLVTATDAASNQTAPVVVPTVTADSTAPGVPISGPLSGSTVGTSTFTFTGTAEAGSLVKVYADTNANGAIDTGEVVVGFEQLAPGQTSYSITVPLVANVANHFLVTATDAAGNQSNPVALPAIVQDSIPPVLPIESNPAAAVSVNANTTTLTGTAEAGSLVKVYADTNANGAIDTGEVVVGFEQLAPGQTSYSITVPLVANVANHFLVTATDAAGNASSPLVVPTVTQDSVAPLLPVVASPTAASTVGTGTYTLTGTAEAGSLVKVYADTNANGDIDTGEVVVGFEQLAPGQTSYSITVPLVANAANHFLVTATDAAGNASSPLVVPTITEDTTPPILPILGSPSAGLSVSTGTTTLTGTAEAGSLVKVYADTNANGAIDTGEVVVGFEQLAPGQTSYSITVPLVANVANHFLVTATDAAGNASSPLVVPTITEDTTPPVLPVSITTSTGTTTTAATSYILTGTAEAGSLVKIYADSNGDGTIDGGEVVVGLLQLAPGQTTYSIDVPLVANQANNFLVTATDAAGNQSAPLTLPPITQESTFQGTVYLDLNASGTLDAGEPGMAGRVVYLDLNHSGGFVTGDPTATTDAAGHFTFTGYAAGSAPVLEDTTRDSTDRYVVDQTATNTDGSVTIGVVPVSAIAPIPVIPNPFTATSGSSATTSFVQSLYRGVLGRDGADSEVAGWVAAMADGETAAQVSAGFVNSLEHRTDEVISYYQDFLHRATDPMAAGWVADLMNGKSEESVVQGILDSPEYLSAHTDPSLLVHDLYLDVLGRQGTTAEVAGWQAAIAAGTTPQSVVASIVTSPEANDQIVESLYTGWLHRQREGATADTWTTMLNANESATAVETGILASDEYQQTAKVGPQS